MKRIQIKKVEIVKIVLFIVLAALLLWYASLVLGYRDGGYYRQKSNEYKALEKNSIDVLFVGSSATDRFWVPAIGWNKDGITSFDFAFDGAPINLYPQIIEECLKTQDPELVVVELRRVYRDADSFSTGRIRRITDNFVTGKTLKSAADEIYKTAEKYENCTIDYTDKSYRYPFLRNHNRWRQLKPECFYDLYPKSSQMGYPIENMPAFLRNVEIDEPKLTDDKEEMTEYSQEALETILDYCDTLDCEVLFTITPMSADKYYYTTNNTAKEIVEARGYTVFDMNTEDYYESIDLNFKTDWYNDTHVNLSGAVKNTNGMLKYFEENYDLENHKDEDKLAEVWNKVYEDLRAIVEEKRPEWLYLLD